MTYEQAKQTIKDNYHLRGKNYKGKEIAALMMCPKDAPSNVINMIIAKAVANSSYEDLLVGGKDFIPCAILQYELDGVTMHNLQLLDKDIQGFR
jgi:hypothetical protein